MSKSPKKRRKRAPKVAPSQPRSMHPEQWLFIGLVAIYALIVAWGLLSRGTWDDDCPMRFYNVRHALNDPMQFISLWNRPLFVLLYVLPLQLGKLSIVFETALIAVVTGYVLVLAAKEAKIANGFLLVPFLALQAYYFPVSFNALTEPLAGLLLALALLFHLRKQYLAFAIIGGLLPLARLELSLLLIIWAVVLVRERQWAYLLILGIPTLLWNLAGWLLAGDPLWLLHQVFRGEENRYGHGSFWQYFHRYIFLTGPAVFYFFFLGLGERFVKRKIDFATTLFSFGFLIYVVFSWKLNIGQAAGFMRNLIPLSPLAAFIALQGYNLWANDFQNKAKNRRVLIYSVVAIVLTILFFSRKMVMHHIVGQEPEYWKLAIIGFLALLFLIRSTVYAEQRTAGFTRFAIPGLVIGITLAYTLITEPPIGLTPERRAMQQIADWYVNNNLQSTPTYANHVWFFYARDLDYYGANFARLTSKNLKKAPAGSVVIWESHYSHRLFGDVKLDFFKDNPNFKPLGQVVTPDKRFGVFVFEKQ